MTDPAAATHLTATQPISDDALARVEQLRRSRGDRAVAPGRRHPAQGARIAAAGFGLAAMLGLVGAMGYANRSTTAVQPATVPTPPPQVVVVIHRTQPATATGNLPVASTPAAGLPVSTPAAPVPAAPIALTAQPVVRRAPAAQTPNATTNASR